MRFSNYLKIFLCAFLCLSALNSLFSHLFATKTITNINSAFKIQNTYQSMFAFQAPFYTAASQKNILERNIFNLSGELPKEDNSSENSDNLYNNFAAQPCAPLSEPFPLEVLGIIYTGNPKTNLVTVQDPEVEGADIYHEGDQILDYPNYFVYRIVNGRTVEFRFGNKKICRSLIYDLPIAVDQANHSTETISSNETSQKEANTVIITRSEITKITEKGLSGLITAMRIAPSFNSGAIEGFKVFSISPGSIFEKIGFQNGDVVKKVNNQSLTEATKGFLIFESFKFDNEIEFTIQRGMESVTRKVIIE